MPVKKIRANCKPRPKYEWFVCMNRHSLLDLSKLPDKLKWLTPACKRVLGSLYDLKRQGKTRVSITALGTQYNTADSLATANLIKLHGTQRQYMELTPHGANVYELVYWVEFMANHRKNRHRRLGEPSPEFQAYSDFIAKEAAAKLSHRKLLDQNATGAPKTGDRTYDMYMSRLPKSLRGIIYQNAIDPRTVYQEYCKYGREYIEETYGAIPICEDNRIVPGCLVTVSHGAQGLVDAVVSRISSDGKVVHLEGGYGQRPADKVKFKAPPLD